MPGVNNNSNLKNEYYYPSDTIHGPSAVNAQKNSEKSIL